MQKKGKIIKNLLFFSLISLFLFPLHCEEGIEIAHKAESEKYSVSIPEVLTGAGFSFYKKFITSQDSSNCPYAPSCSQYMKDAVRENGFFGIIQGLERKRRCTRAEHSRNLYPLTENGKHSDPVVSKNTERDDK